MYALTCRPLEETNKKNTQKNLIKDGIMIKKIDHLGIAVKSLDESIPFYESLLGLKCTAIEEVAEQKVRTAFIPCGEVLIELLEPTSEDSPIAKFIEKKGEGIHHVAYLTDNLPGELKREKSKVFN